MLRKLRLGVLTVLVLLLTAALGSGIALGQPAGESENLLANPGFEEVDSDNTARAAGWSVHSIEQVHLVPEAARTGELGVKMATDSGNVRVQQRVPIEPGKTYELSVWVKATQVGKGYARLKYEYWPPKGQSGTVKEVNSPAFPLTNLEEWTLITMQDEAPEGAESLGILIRLYGPGEAYFDDAMVRVVD